MAVPTRIPRAQFLSLSAAERAGLLFILTAVVGYSFLPVFTAQLRTQGMEPIPIALWRYVLAVPLYWLLVRLRARAEAEPPGQRLPWARLFALGVSFAIAAVCAFYGFSQIPAGTYVVIFYTYPAIIALIALFLGERLNGWGWAAVGLTLVGVALTAPGFAEGLTGDNLSGVVIALVNAAVVAVYFTASGRLLRGHRAITQATAIAVTGALTALCLVALVTGLFAFPPPGAWISLLGMAVVSTIMPTLAVANGIQRVGPTRAGLFGTIEPLVTAFLAFAFIGEAMQPVQLVGGLVIIASVVLLQTRGAPKTAAAQAAP